MIIRPFTSDDIPRLIEIGHMAHEESEYRTMEFSEEKCKHLCRQIILKPEMFGRVAERDGVIVGVAIGGIFPPYFSSDLNASDLLFYVLPEHRGSRAFYVLCIEFIAWAKISGAKLIFMRNTTGVMPGKVGELYERMGFSKVGGIYRMEV